MVYIDSDSVGEYYYSFLNSQVLNIYNNMAQGLISRDEGNILLAEYRKAISEYEIMKESDQIYRISISCSKDLGEGKGATNYNPADKVIDMAVNISLKTSACGIIAHEFMHLYQFEVGQLSFDVTDGHPGRLYSEKDEINAYNRQFIIEFGVDYYRNQDRYKMTKKRLYSEYEQFDYKTVFENARNNRNTNILRVKQKGKFNTISQKL